MEVEVEVGAEVEATMFFIKAASSASYSRDGYHISYSKAQEYEAELAAFMKDMVASTSAPTSASNSTSTAGEKA